MNNFPECSQKTPKNFEKYKICGNVTNFCKHLEEVEKIETVLIWAIFIIPCVMCLFALILNIHNVYVLIRMFRLMDDRTKKRYVFVLSRAFSSTMSIISIFLLPITILLTDYNFYLLAIFLIFDMLSFLSFLGGVVGTTLTIYVVVVHPVFYQRELSFRKCLLILLIFWVCSAIVAIGCGTVQAAFMGKNPPFHCDYNTCEKPVLMFALVSISITFAFTLGIQFFVIFSLFWHEYKSKERGDISSSSKSMESVKRRLISVFVVFLLMAVFEVTSAWILVRNVFSISSQISSVCATFASSGSRLEFVIFCSVLTLLWALGLFLDPIFSLLFDPIFSKEFTKRMSLTIKRLQSKISLK